MSSSIPCRWMQVNMLDLKELKHLPACLLVHCINIIVNKLAAHLEQILTLLILIEILGILTNTVVSTDAFIAGICIDTC